MTIEQLLEKLGYLAKARKAPDGGAYYYGMSNESLGRHEGQNDMSEELQAILDEFKSKPGAECMGCGDGRNSVWCSTCNPY